jgi:hypothetical protein
MKRREVKYRVEVDYLSKDYEEAALSTSSPIYNLKDGWKAYKEAIKEFCVDDKSVPARVHFWKYNYVNHAFCPITIAKNY